MLELTPDLLTGIAEVDDQHRELFARVRALYAGIGAGRADEVARTLEFLGEYVTSHFASEERLMEARGYPDLARHRAEHRELEERYSAHREAFASSDGSKLMVAAHLASFVGDWLRRHVRASDGEVGRFVAAQDGRRSA